VSLVGHWSWRAHTTSRWPAGTFRRTETSTVHTLTLCRQSRRRERRGGSEVFTEAYQAGARVELPAQRDSLFPFNLHVWDSGIAFSKSKSTHEPRQQVEAGRRVRVCSHPALVALQHLAPTPSKTVDLHLPWTRRMICPRSEAPSD